MLSTIFSTKKQMYTLFILMYFRKQILFNVTDQNLRRSDKMVCVCCTFEHIECRNRRNILSYTTLVNNKLVCINNRPNRSYLQKFSSFINISKVLI